MISPRGLPPEPEQQLRVTTLELFFDLVFVFTITQLTGVLYRDPSARSAAQVLLVFCVLWWMYGGYAWLTNTRTPSRTPERVLLLLGMSGFLIIGLAIPGAFTHHADGVALGIGYLVVILVHAGLYLRVNKNFQQVLPFNLLSAGLVIAAGLTPLGETYVLWTTALAVQALSPLVVRPSGKFRIEPSHFVERHGALIIVAFGESVADVGFGIRATSITIPLAISAVLGLALTAALWWVFFGTGDDDRAELAMRAAEPDLRPQFALNAYFYAYIPMLLGVLSTAAGLRRAVGDPGAALSSGPALALSGGVALFLAGDALFRHFLSIGLQRYRLVPAALCLAVAWPVAAGLAASAAIALLTAIIAIALLAESRSRPQFPR